ncbi:hypothetical protein ACFYXM_36250 [Streptomyces sp. NPDC002476]|uniref:hypothetical protein n=1 Tax=Streptomyces sp. NPDC002476 TaxID=3364648 RepID=UPI0036745AEC
MRHGTSTPSSGGDPDASATGAPAEEHEVIEAELLDDLGSGTDDDSDEDVDV